jgi:intracellular sulfur oxidation DsrE/DsrF family protein
LEGQSAGPFDLREESTWPVSKKKEEFMTNLTYEEFLDEVTTVLTELYEIDDATAIKLVVDAQAADFFVRHDDQAEMRTVEQAKKDAITLFENKQNKQKTQEKQQQRLRQKK